MKLLIVSDIHANWPALRAIPEDADVVVCLGDMVSYGPYPRECMAWVRMHATYVVRGNHDTALAYGEDSRARGFKRELAHATLIRHELALSHEEVAWLRRLPTEERFRFADHTYHAVHASPLDTLYSYRITPDLPERELESETMAVRADFLLLGHTHLPLIRGVRSTVVVNPGSVGQPLDGDPRASYGVIRDGVPEIHRVAYDVEETVKGIRDMGLADHVAKALQRLLRTGEPLSDAACEEDAGQSAGPRGADAIKTTHRQ
jgi:putative phosphoesterase